MIKYYLHGIPSDRLLEGFFLIPSKNNEIIKKEVINLLKKIRYFKSPEFLNVEYNEYEYKIYFKLVVNTKEWNDKAKTNLFIDVIDYLNTLDYSNTIPNMNFEEEN